MRNRAFGRGNDVDGVTAMDCRSVTEGWKLTARGASRGRDGRRAQALALAARPTAGQCCLVIWILVETLIAGIIYARTGVRCREGLLEDSSTGQLCCTTATTIASLDTRPPWSFCAVLPAERGLLVDAPKKNTIKRRTWKRQTWPVAPSAFTL